MENEDELADKVIDFCEALKKYKGGETAKKFVNAITSSALFREMHDCAFNEKLLTSENLNTINQ